MRTPNLFNSYERLNTTYIALSVCHIVSSQDAIKTLLLQNFHPIVLKLHLRPTPSNVFPLEHVGMRFAKKTVMWLVRGGF